MSTQSTSLNLLARDGALTITFSPGLNGDQYAALLRELEKDGDTRDGLTQLVSRLAKQWRTTLHVDPC